MLEEKGKDDFSQHPIQQHSGGSRQYSKENNQTDTKPDRIRNNVADNRQFADHIYRGYKEWKKKIRKYLSRGLTKHTGNICVLNNKNY